MLFYPGQSRKTFLKRGYLSGDVKEARGSHLGSILSIPLWSIPSSTSSVKALLTNPVRNVLSCL